MTFFYILFYFEMLKKYDYMIFHIYIAKPA